MRFKIVPVVLTVIGVLTIIGCSAAAPANQIPRPGEELASADALLAAGKYDQSIQAFDRIIESRPSAGAYLSRGKAYYYSGNYMPAVDDFSSCLEIDQDNIDAHNFRGWAQVANGAIDRAKADFDSLVSLKPSMLVGYNGRQWCNANLAQWDQGSLLYLYQKFESEVGLLEAYKAPSWDFVKQMQWDIAIVPNPSAAIKSNPVISEVYCDLGFCCFKKGQWAAAISDLQAAYKKDPGLNKGSWNIDWARSKSKSWDKVIDDDIRMAQILTGNAIGEGFISAQDTPGAWKQAALKCYLQALQSGDQASAKASAGAIDLIRTWEQEINLPD